MVNKRTVAVLTLILVTLTSNAQHAFSAKKESPEKLKRIAALVNTKDKITEGWTWKDKLGVNTLVLFSGVKYSTSNPGNTDFRNKDLNVYHFIATDTGSGYRLLWKMKDYVRDCEFDVTCEFFKNAVSITDLDTDSIAETTVIYHLSCKSDVSPDEMKLIMHEGTVKLALRGLMCDPANGEHQENCAKGELDLSKMTRLPDEIDQYIQSFGRYANEKDFEKATPAFLAHAKSQWLRFVKKFE